MDRKNVGNGGSRWSTNQENQQKINSTETKGRSSGKIIRLSEASRKRTNSNSIPESIRSAIEYADSLNW